MCATWWWAKRRTRRSRSGHSRRIHCGSSGCSAGCAFMASWCGRRWTDAAAATVRNGSRSAGRQPRPVTFVPRAETSKGRLPPLTWEAVSGFEPLTCRLQVVRPHAPSALAATTTQVIALMAPAALGLSCASSHEPFHADGGQKSMAVTGRSGQKPPQRRRDFHGPTGQSIRSLHRRIGSYLDQAAPLRAPVPKRRDARRRKIRPRPVS